MAKRNVEDVSDFFDFAVEKGYSASSASVKNRERQWNKLYDELRYYIEPDSGLRTFSLKDITTETPQDEHEALCWKILVAYMTEYGYKEVSFER